MSTADAGVADLARRQHGAFSGAQVDGYEVHGSPRAMARDFVRQNGLVPYGWRVLRFTWMQVVREPGMVGTVISASRAGVKAG